MTTYPLRLGVELGQVRQSDGNATSLDSSGGDVPVQTSLPALDPLLGAADGLGVKVGG